MLVVGLLKQRASLTEPQEEVLGRKEEVNEPADIGEIGREVSMVLNTGHALLQQEDLNPKHVLEW